MSDNDIIAHIREGDDVITADTYKRYRKEFIRWLKKKYYCQEDDAKELYQLTFLTFYNQVMSGKLTYITASIKTYLFGIGKNKFYQQQREQSRFEYTLNEEKEGSFEEIDFNLNVKENQYLRLEQAMDRLGEPCRQILIMKYYENRNMDFIAEKLGYKNAATAKNQKYKCKSRLRKLIGTTLKIDDEHC